MLEAQDVFPFGTASHVLTRTEELLLGLTDDAPPYGGAGQPLDVVHFDIAFQPKEFAPPVGVYEGEYLRLEWQQMDFRQPFYHRNADVDELSYQIAGFRTLMTELGTVELEPGDYSLIPRGVAHDNYGRQESHLLFYIPAPVQLLPPVLRTSEPRIPPFPGWEQAPKLEFTTDCLGGPGHPPVSISPVDERQLLEQVDNETARLEVVRGDRQSTGTTWLYRGDDVVLGHCHQPDDDGRHYIRHLDADEVQYQISGQRTLVTQRGALTLEPGDFVRIPVGVAFASIHAEPSAHIRLASRRPLPQVAPGCKKGQVISPLEIERLRNDCRPRVTPERGADD
ncbi:hypothetical protein [Mycobacterium deserti]|uniref:Homogentisate 1,2-dioxygenase n=1 Tax=Mycobacterium deserti TaxID=2978347 RepID=A0ABT2M6W7_9MYCO|nr:hypothetical protein [Mycobacterium deserti]MCT7658011.1 hypothetical protein [Mycobacterium deserti]